MIRRFAVLAVGLVAAASLSSCATFDRADAVAEVGDEQLSTAELDDLTGSTMLAYALFGDATVVDPQNAETARAYMSQWAVLSFADQDGFLDDVSEDDAKSFLDSQLGVAWRDEAPITQELFVRLGRLFTLNSNGADLQPLQDALGTADVWVASRYGRWDEASLVVAPMNG